MPRFSHTLVGLALWLTLAPHAGAQTTHDADAAAPDPQVSVWASTRRIHDATTSARMAAGQALMADDKPGWARVLFEAVRDDAWADDAEQLAASHASIRAHQAHLEQGIRAGRLSYRALPHRHRRALHHVQERPTYVNWTQGFRFCVVYMAGADWAAPLPSEWLPMSPEVVAYVVALDTHVARFGGLSADAGTSDGYETLAAEVLFAHGHLQEVRRRLRSIAGHGCGHKGYGWIAGALEEVGRRLRLQEDGERLAQLGETPEPSDPLVEAFGVDELRYFGGGLFGEMCPWPEVHRIVPRCADCINLTTRRQLGPYNIYGAWVEARIREEGDGAGVDGYQRLAVKFEGTHVGALALYNVAAIYIAYAEAARDPFERGRGFPAEAVAIAAQVRRISDDPALVEWAFEVLVEDAMVHFDFDAAAAYRIEQHDWRVRAEE